jgi:predicted nucleic acid binding AN1-type Zn finger protein
MGHCKCGETFCCRHKAPEDHSCTYDFQKEARDKLAEKLPRICANKVVAV